MKTITRTLAVAIITPIALTITISASHALAHKVERARCAAAVAIQPSPEMLNGSYDNVITTLNAISGR